MNDTTIPLSLTDEQIDAIAHEHFCKGMGDKEGDWGPNTLNQQWCESIGRPFARAVLAHVFADDALRLAGAAGLDPDPDVVGAAIGEPASSEISDLTACSPLGPGEDEYLSWVRLIERQRLAAAGVDSVDGSRDA